MRKYYLDNIRWATVLLVLVYHVCYIFNGLGIPGGIPGAESISVFDTAAAIVYPWFMVLLFVVAGISARYSLEKRTGKQFLRERAVKLLVPSTLGLFVIHWITGYFNIKLGGGLAFIPAPLVYPISVISGIGPLWFIQMLFLFSCILVLLRKLDKGDRLWNLCAGANGPVILLLAVPVFAGAQIGNLPVLTMYRFGIYFVSFLIGYYVFSHDGVQEKIKTMALPMLCIGVVCAVLYTVTYHGRDYTASECLQSVLTNLYLWAVVLAVLGCFRKFFDRETPVTRYLTRASFGLYILHYPVLMVVCYLLETWLTLPAIGNYAIALAAEVVLTFAAYEGIRRVPVVRFLVLGIGGGPKKAER